MPAARRARVLTHIPWWSRLASATGRSATTSSSSRAVGRPPGKAAIAQPPPWIQSRSGMGVGVVADVREIGAAVGGEPAQVAGEPLEPALDGVDVGVGEAGQQEAARHVDDVAPTGVDVVADARIRPPSTTTSPTLPRWRKPSNTAAFRKTVTLTCQSSLAATKDGTPPTQRARTATSVPLSSSRPSNSIFSIPSSSLTSARNPLAGWAETRRIPVESQAATTEPA